MKGICDTGFLVAFANRRDRHHRWAVDLAEQLTEPLLTCEAVLAETAFRLQDTRLVLDMIHAGLVVPALDILRQLPRVVELAIRFADRKPDLADLCIIRLSELYPRHGVITVDIEDFRIYRRNRNDRIPLIVPPGLG
jgi:predicted nucleic acid-binding protein